MMWSAAAASALPSTCPSTTMPSARTPLARIGTATDAATNSTRRIGLRKFSSA